jgi:hypothetical protein
MRVGRPQPAFAGNPGRDDTVSRLQDRIETACDAETDESETTGPDRPCDPVAEVVAVTGLDDVDVRTRRNPRFERHAGNDNHVLDPYCSWVSLEAAR